MKQTPRYVVKGQQNMQTQGVSLMASKVLKHGFEKFYQEISNISLQCSKIKHLFLYDTSTSARPWQLMSTDSDV